MKDTLLTRVPLTRSRSYRASLLAMLVATGAGLISMRSPAMEPAAAPADMVLKNGSIYTVDGSHRTVEALAVAKGKIVFAGGNLEAASYIGPNTVVEDAHGKLVLPGLIDAHLHPLGIVDFGGCSLASKAHTLAEIATIVRGCIDRMKIPAGHWLGVSLWEYASGNQTDPKHLTLRAALDDASATNPIVIQGWDGHHAAYNSAALALAKNAKGQVVGYSKKTLATDFAAYQPMVGIDGNGEPAGDLQDDAQNPIDSSEVQRENAAKLLAHPEKLSQQLASDGITGAQDAAASEYVVYDKLIANGQMTFRLNIAQFWEPEDFEDANGRINWDQLFSKANAVRAKYASNPLVRADAVKLFADGDLEANPNNVPPTFGAAPRPVPYLQPIFEKDAHGILSVKGYVDPGTPQCVYARAHPDRYSKPTQIADFIATYGYHPGQCAISYGVPEHAPAVFKEYIKRAHLAGYTIHIHTISDTSSHTVVEALEEARAADGVTSHPDTIAHLQCATPADVQRIGRDHLFVVFTYSWMYAEPAGYDLSTVPFWDKIQGNSYEALHNPHNYYEQCVYPAKTVMDAGAITAAGSDAPVLATDPQPFVNMELGVTRARRGLPPISPWQRLTVKDVIDAYTINGARALDRASEIGSIEVGKSADFIIVDQNILQLANEGHPEKIGDTKVLETWFMGKKVFSRSDD